jgi:hypothetical protein
MVHRVKCDKGQQGKKGIVEDHENIFTLGISGAAG